MFVLDQPDAPLPQRRFAAAFQPAAVPCLSTGSALPVTGERGVDIRIGAGDKVVFNLNDRRFGVNRGQLGVVKVVGTLDLTVVSRDKTVFVAARRGGRALRLGLRHHRLPEPRFGMGVCVDSRVGPGHPQPAALFLHLRQPCQTAGRVHQFV